jgi:hypothetical protein
MTKGERTYFFDTLTRMSVIVIALCASPLYILYAYFGFPGTGRVAAICAFVIMTVAREFWDLRKCSWFWLTLSIVVLLHVPLILLVPWNTKNYPGVALPPFGLLDFALVHTCFIPARRAMKANGVPTPQE